MKHLVFLLLACVAIYSLYQLATPRDRRKSTKFLTKHGTRVAAIAAVLLAMLIAAYYIPSTSIL